MKSSCLLLAALLGACPNNVLAQASALQDVSGRLAAPAEATTIYVAKEFLTMDAKRPRAAAIAVRGGKFSAVGSLEEVKAAAGAEARVDETFAGKVVCAGFVEQHVHPVLAALTMSTKVISIEDWDAIDGFSPAVRDPAGYEKRLREAIAAHRAGPDRAQPLVTWGYHHYMHGSGMSRALLNELAPDFPVIVWHRSCHEFFLNDAALKEAKIDQAYYEKMPKLAQSQTNLERGYFFEQGAMTILGNIAPMMATKEIFTKGLQFTEDFYHRSGITTCCEPGGFYSKPLQMLINSVYSDDATPFNHYFIGDGKSFAANHPNDPAEMLKETESILNWGSGRTAYLPKQVKLFTDGAIFSQLMMMRDGYADGHQGAWILDPPALGQAFQAYWDAGYQIHIHNNGDGGFDVLLGELQKAMQRKPRQDHRTVLSHFGFARPEQVEKWIKLGGIISSNPYYVTALAGRYGKLGMTEEWAQNMVPHGEVLKHGGSLSFHSDMPMAPAKPLQLLWSAVNRLTYEGEVAGPHHKVPLDIALRAITIDAAFSIQLEKRVGSIETGKDANLTVLERSPYDVAPGELKGIGIWGTMLEGRVQQAKAAVKRTASAQPPVSDHGAIVSDEEKQAALLRERILNPGGYRAASACQGSGCACQFGHVLSSAILAQSGR